MPGRLASQAVTPAARARSHASSLRSRRVLGAFVIACAFAVSGCMVGPDFVRPTAEVPERFAEAPSHDVPAGAPSRWWQAFGDPELDALVDRAVAANLDLAIAESRVREARSKSVV